MTASARPRTRVVYIIGSNMPGYLPDSDNFIVGTRRSAVRTQYAKAKDYYHSASADGLADDGRWAHGANGDYWVSPGGRSGPTMHYWTSEAYAELITVDHVRCTCCDTIIGRLGSAEAAWYVSEASAYVCRDCIP